MAPQEWRHRQESFLVFAFINCMLIDLTWLFNCCCIADILVFKDSFNVQVVGDEEQEEHQSVNSKVFHNLFPFELDKNGQQWMREQI